MTRPEQSSNANVFSPPEPWLSRGLSKGLTGSHQSLPELCAHAETSSTDAGTHLGVDIGGTLTKMVFLEKPGKDTASQIRDFLTSRTKYGSSGERDEELAVDVEGGRLHFVRFATSDIKGAVNLVLRNELQRGIRRVYTAGGGAHKHAPLFRKALDVDLVPADELDTVVRGLSWLAEHVMGEVFAFEAGQQVPLAVQRDEDNRPMVSLTGEPDSWRPLFPMLVVNIGTGVSILRVRSSADFERVSGTALGGGTYWGLCQLLTGCSDFEEASRLAAQADASAVNLEVRDIYGGDYVLPSGSVLPGTLIASFFAKAHGGAEPGSGAILRALATMIAQNVCQIALLNTRIHGTQHVVFTGNFLRQNPVAVETISSNFQRVASVMSCNGMQPKALFLRHEGYFGALGSLLLNWKTETQPVMARCRLDSDPAPSTRLRPRSGTRGVIGVRRRLAAASVLGFLLGTSATLTGAFLWRRFRGRTA
eukprot:TRINITY_DN19469_c0_g1_i1.p1 TRINITY_DN19469_c0_g1~~TRINITY_DN19469_c0_g1_i1.p1  ORF type:complete len:478 (+),score=61.77 TRINITY_DN19469_c0_g1_i1:180-1613(+)